MLTYSPSGFQYPLRVNSLSSINCRHSFYPFFEFQYPLRVNSLSSQREARRTAWEQECFSTLYGSIA